MNTDNFLEEYSKTACVLHINNKRIDKKDENMESCEMINLYAKQQAVAFRAQSLLLCTKWGKQIATPLTYNEESLCYLMESQVYFL